MRTILYIIIALIILYLVWHFVGKKEDLPKQPKETEKGLDPETSDLGRKSISKGSKMGLLSGKDLSDIARKLYSALNSGASSTGGIFGVGGSPDLPSVMFQMKRIKSMAQLSEVSKMFAIVFKKDFNDYLKQKFDGNPASYNEVIAYIQNLPEK